MAEHPGLQNHHPWAPSVLPPLRQVPELNIVLGPRPAPAPAKVEQVDAAYVTVRPCPVVHKDFEEDADQEDDGAQADTAEEESCSVAATQHFVAGDDEKIVVELYEEVFQRDMTCFWLEIIDLDTGRSGGRTRDFD